MISNLSPLNQQFLNNLNRISDRAVRAQRQISSGVRLARVSDDPAQVSSLLSARANLAQIQQIDANLGRVRAEVDAGEQAIQSSVELFERVRSLGAQAATGTATAESRNTLAQETGSILEQLAGLAATKVEGRYIFSGDTDQAAPYAIDLSQAIPYSAYQGSAATRVAQHPNGTTFRTSLTAQDIFDSAAPQTNVFAAVAALRQAMLDNDGAAIQTALENLTAPGDYLNDQLAFYGTSQNKIAQAKDFGGTLQVQLQGQIANIEDADLSGAILEMNQAQIQLEAALNARAKLPQSSLFDYLA